MKIKTIIATAFACMAIAACAQNSSAVGAVDGQPTKAQTDSVSYLLGIHFASMAQSYGFDKDMNYKEIMAGMHDFAFAEGNQRDPEFVDQFKIDPNLMNELFTDYLQQLRDAKGAKNLAEGKAFLESNKKNDGVAVTESGLQYQVIEKGSDLVPGPDDMVEVKYKGTLLDGTVFDESGDESVSFPLSAVIPGWTEGMQHVGEGGKIKLFIPADLAYGESGSGPIGPNSTIIFDVELVKVTRAEEAAE